MLEFDGGNGVEVGEGEKIERHGENEIAKGERTVDKRE